MNNIVLRTIVNLISRLLLYLSIYLLWRGHNAPGGGFIGGIIAAIGFVFYAIIYGPGKTRERIKLPPMYYIGGGLFFSALSTVISVFTGRQPLTGLWIDIPLPVIEDIHLGTPFLFDMGVYLVVFGMITAIIINIMEVLRWN
ncbi:cation:proton antiporter [Marinilabiliaceae bacterium JC017]|nr:cation:proton antiporter [Marinilabiliaceae bacterium JC017]